MRSAPRPPPIMLSIPILYIRRHLTRLVSWKHTYTHIYHINIIISSVARTHTKYEHGDTTNAYIYMRYIYMYLIHIPYMYIWYIEVPTYLPTRDPVRAPEPWILYNIIIYVRCFSIHLLTISSKDPPSHCTHNILYYYILWTERAYKYIYRFMMILYTLARWLMAAVWMDIEMRENSRSPRDYNTHLYCIIRTYIIITSNESAETVIRTMGCVRVYTYYIYIGTALCLYRNDVPKEDESGTGLYVYTRVYHVTKGEVSWCGQRVFLAFLCFH